MSSALTRTPLFGTLFEDAEVAALFGAEAMLGRMVAFEVALTDGLAELGAIGVDAARDACEAMRAFRPDWSDIAESADRDGLPVPALVRQLRGAAGEGAEKIVHIGATSQDLIDTASVLGLLELADLLRARLEALISGLDNLAERDGHRVLMGHTRMQAALPISAADRLASWTTPLREHVERLADMRARIGRVQYGGAVGLRDMPKGQGDDLARRIASRLGLERVGPVWHSARAGMVEFGGWLVLLAGSLGKIGQDIVLMAQQEADEITISGGGGSSAMPHKQNPFHAELLVSNARYVAALQGGLGQAMVHEQERSGAAWALEWMLLPPMAEAAGVSLRHAAALVGRIERIGGSVD